MLNDVTFGQYYPTQSFVHKADPRVKLLALIAYIVALFIAKNFCHYDFSTIFANKIHFNHLKRS